MSATRGRAIAVVAILLVLGVIFLRAREPVTRARWLVFGSLTSVELRGVDAALAAALVDRLQRLTREREDQWHPWRESELTRLNAALAQGGSAVAPRPLLDLIAASRPLVARSHGLFDPGAGALIEAWGFHTSDWPARSAAPDEAFLGAWRADPPSLAHIVVDGDRVSATRRDVKLDFNAIAEGAAAREMAELLRGEGARDALIDMGGDVYAIGQAGTRAWRVAIADPHGGELGEVALGDGEGLFVSGAYSKYRQDGPHRRAHVVDPRSGAPVEDALTSAVVHTDPLLADAAATALLAAGADEWVAVARDLGVDCALLVTADGVMHLTPAMARRLERAPRLAYRESIEAP